MSRFRPQRVVLFLSLTFFLSWGIDWLIDKTMELRAYADLGMTPLGMLMPAFVGAVLRIFVLKDCRAHFTTHGGAPRRILLAFLTVTFMYGGVIVLALSASRMRGVWQGAGALLLTLWILWVFFVFSRSERDSLERSDLRLGDVGTGQRFILAVVVFMLAQSGLNLLFGLGELQSRAESVYDLPIPTSLYVPALIIVFIPVTVIGIPLSGLAATFGEEYGWRGFLQDELVKLGRLPGVLLVGVAWGIWHIPIILRGIHTYPPSWPGLLLGLVFFVLWGIVQSYAVLKTGSIWPAAFMHGVVNSVHGFMLRYVVRPSDPLCSFGLGIYGLLSIAAVVAVILHDPVWWPRSGVESGQPR